MSLTFASAIFAEDRPNVLFIAADDLRCDLACYGHPTAITPHLDALAQRGTLFERAYCAQALCNPARSSLLTGLRPNTLEQYDLSKHFRDQFPDVVTLPEYFKQQGYFTQNIGKIFHNWRTEIQGDPQSWSVPAVMHFDSHRNDVAILDAADAVAVQPQLSDSVATADSVSGEQPDAVSQAQTLPPNRVTTIRCECRDVPDDAYFDGRITELAIDALKQHADSEQPFFLAVGFWKPHLPFNAPKKYWDLYDRQKLTTSRCPQWPTGTPRIAWHNSQELVGKKGDVAELTHEQQLDLHHGYLAGISYMDAQVGRLLDQLKRSGLAENTLVVFWSDHGFQLGDHTLWCKTSNFELDAKVPLIIAPPGGAAVRRTDAIVELLDLYPTITEMCGLKIPGGPEGVSLKPLIEGTGTWVKKAALTQHPRPAYYGNAMKAMGHSIRTERFRLTHWHSRDDGTLIGSELYDHDVDPDETINQIENPEYAEQLPRLQELFDALTSTEKGGA